MAGPDGKGMAGSRRLPFARRVPARASGWTEPLFDELTVDQLGQQAIPSVLQSEEQSIHSALFCRRCRMETFGLESRIWHTRCGFSTFPLLDSRSYQFEV
ncbi:MAG: hypothetical protein ABIN58_04500 [candidate division WOR-3 bacterium]